MPGLVSRARAWFERIAGSAVTAPGGRWLWPMGNGDRGPPGSWQQNVAAPHTAYELIAFSAVYACIHSIAADISKLPTMVFDVDLDTGAKTPRRADYYVQLMAAPNSFQTGPDFLYCFVQSYLFQGNTFVF